MFETNPYFFVCVLNDKIRGDWLSLLSDLRSQIIEFVLGFGHYPNFLSYKVLLWVLLFLSLKSSSNSLILWSL